MGTSVCWLLSGAFYSLQRLLAVLFILSSSSIIDFKYFPNIFLLFENVEEKLLMI